MEDQIARYFSFHNICAKYISIGSLSICLPVCPQPAFNPPDEPPNPWIKGPEEAPPVMADQEQPTSGLAPFQI